MTSFSVRRDSVRMRSLVGFVLFVAFRIAASQEENCVSIEKRFKEEYNEHKQPVCVCADKEVFSTIDGYSIECESASISAVTENLNSLNGTVLGGVTIRDSILNVLPVDIFENVFPKRLRLERCGISSLATTAFGSAAKTIESLSLRDNRLKKLEKAQFGPLSAMKLLDLSLNKIQEIETGAFENLQSVEELLLNGNEIHVLTPGMFEGLSGLKRLNLERCSVQKIEKGAFRGLNSLEQLILSDNLLETVESSMFAELQSLRILDLGSNRLRTVEIKTMSRLEKLVLNHNRIESMKAIRLKELPALVVAMFDKNNIQKLADVDLIGFSRSKSLETLSVAWNNISSISAKAFQYIPNLLTLLLQNNQISELSKDSAPFLAQFKKLATLQVSANNLTVVRAGELPKTLVNLALDHNSISRIEPRALEGLKLKRIYLHSNKLQYLYQGAFDSFAPTSIEAIDVSLNSWSCVCSDTKEWLPRWLAEAEEADVSEGPVGCLAIPGCGLGGKLPNAEDLEEDTGRSAWITVAAALLTVITIAIMISIAVLYFKDHRYQFPLRGGPSDSDLHKLIENDPLNLPTDSILVVPAMPRRNPSAPKKTVRFQNF